MQTSPTAQPKRVLVVVKQTLKSLALASDEERFKRLLQPECSENGRIERTDQEHRLTLQHVVDTLHDRNIDARCVAREPGEHFDVGDEELIVTVGGDGTFLDASHSVRGKVPMLGVNSAPNSSFGHFCLTDRSGFADVLDSILSGVRKPFPLLRLQLSIDCEAVDVPVLNEILVSHSCPAGTARYKLEVGGATAEHKSSGLIVSTPSGSTGFMRSAGGPIADITDQTFAWWVDKPFRTPSERFPLRGGEVSDNRMVVTSGMFEGQIYIDGAHISCAFPRGSKLTVSVYDSPLLAYVNANCHDRFKADADTW
ncbi:MAG: NAD(+)/NADH kinase [Candidatus Melainabacteria bacterium]|nr:NAD(+)/NADH kinase [Candidatus Melainabacteria bacterium]